jgi:hypothetical protein
MSVRAFQSVVSSLAEGPRADLSAALLRNLERSPRCGVTRFLLACQQFDGGRPATAVRNLMTAHHAEPELESAALLVFAGLNWLSRRANPLLPVLLDTWEEFRRPEFDRTPRERALLDAFAEASPGLEHVSMLARRLWRLPIRTLRAQIRSAVAERSSGPYALLLAPA